MLPNICFLCEDDVEDSYHLFIGCRYVREVWAHFISLWNLYWVFCSSIGEVWSQWVGPSSNPALLFLWSLSIPHLAWGIWLECNNKFFRDSDLPSICVAFKICEAIKENFVSKVSFQNGPRLCLCWVTFLLRKIGSFCVISLFL